MRTPQAEVFGLPNPILGVVGLALVVTVAVSLLAGAVYPRVVWLGLQAGATLGVVFVHWLIYQSPYRIGALCPYCMVVWVATIAIFWYVTLYNMRCGGGRLSSGGPLGRACEELHGVILTGWVLVVVTLIANRFWDYWLTLLR